MKTSPAIIVPTVSLGRTSAGHKLLDKMDAAARHGYSGIELTFECLVDLAELLASDTPRPDKLRLAARKARQRADELGIDICVLQAFSGFDGLLGDENFAERLAEAKLWIRLARILKADVIQVPSNALEEHECSGTLELIVSHLQQLADAGKSTQPGEQTMRFAYENMEWSTHIKTWQESLHVVELVNRSNFGLCLDTFHIAGLLYGSPTTVGGVRPDGAESLKQSLAEMQQRLDISKVFLLQLSDATLLDPPLPYHPFYDPSQRPGLTWSRNGRPFPCTTGYLPVVDVARVIYDLGYTGLSSLEVFMPEHHSRCENIPDKMASLGMQSWEAVVKRVGLNNGIDR